MGGGKSLKGASLVKPKILRFLCALCVSAFVGVVFDGIA
jgi:hypothetical protein